MATYVAEAYLSRSRAGDLPAIAERVRAATREVAMAGAEIAYLRSTFVPEDEICFHVFEAASPAAVGEASSRAGIGPMRIVRAIREGDKVL